MILSFRFGLSTAVVLFLAVMAKLSASLITEFTVSQVPFIWTFMASWLRPPYLYLVINCIIITIFASSKLQKHVTDYYSEPDKIPEDDYYGKLQKHVTDYYSEPDKIPEDHYYGNGNVSQSKLVEVMQPHSPLEIKFKYEVSDEFDLNGINADDSVPQTKSPALVKDVHVDDSCANFEEINDDIILEHPVNKRLRVSKPKRELDTLESTWHTITNGQTMPLSREHMSCGNLQDQHKMINSETFNEKNSSHRINNMSKRLARSCGPGKLRRDPSLGPEELNKRAEAFINRFKEDMRLQRKESLNRYAETINSCTY